MNELVEYAPCVFCGYNGAGFYQAGTHAEACPWYTVGGGEERSVMLRKVVASLFKERRHSSHNKQSIKLPKKAVENIVECISIQQDIPIDFKAVLVNNFWDLL